MLGNALGTTNEMKWSQFAITTEIPELSKAIEEYSSFSNAVNKARAKRGVLPLGRGSPDSFDIL